MRMLSLFSGIGAFEKALDRLGVSIDLVNYCEIDKYASKAFSLIHNSKTRRGRVTTGYANTLLCNDAQGVITENLEIRKLTPKECFRLMGFDDRDVDTLRDNGISDAQLYKMAGNSIVVDVVYHIFEQLRSRYPDIFPRGQMSIEDLMREEV